MKLAGVRSAGRILLVLAIVAGMAAAWLHRDALSPRALEIAMARSPEAPLFFLLAHIVTSLLFIPRSLIVIAAGMLFGLWWGIFWAALGSVIGSVAGFLVARYVNNGLVALENLPRFGPFIARAEQGGWRMVALIRVLPIMNHSLLNYAFGLTKVPLGAYTLGSLIGQLPTTVAFVEFGAAGERIFSGEEGWLLPTLIGAGALAISILVPRLVQKRS